jgi:hypothetical protein
MESHDRKTEKQTDFNPLLMEFVHPFTAGAISRSQQ